MRPSTTPAIRNILVVPLLTREISTEFVAGTGSASIDDVESGRMVRRQGSRVGLVHVEVSLKVPGTSAPGYQGSFLVDTGATDSMAAASDLSRAGIQPVGRKTHEMADGSLHEYRFGLAQIEVMGEVTAGRVIFGPEGVEPILGVTVLESIGLVVDPSSQSLRRLPAIPLK